MSNAENFIKRLDQYIEYAEATKRFADVGFYEELKQFISIQSELDEALRKQREACADAAGKEIDWLEEHSHYAMKIAILNATIEDE